MIREIQKLKNLGNTKRAVTSIMAFDKLDKHFTKYDNISKYDWEELKKNIEESINIVFTDEEDE